MRSTRSARAATSSARDVFARAVDLGEAVGAASALRARQARARVRRTHPARAGTGATGEVLRHRLHHRRRGSRPPRAVARRDRRRVRRQVARRLGRLRPGDAGVPEARAGSDRLPRRPRPPAPAAASRCAWSRARTGTARSSARRSTARPAIRCSRASRTPTCPTSPTRAACSKPATRSTRCSPPTTRRRSRRSTGARRAWAAPRTSSSRSCTAWATTSTPR